VCVVLFVESWSHENCSRRLVVGRYSCTRSRLMAVQLALLYNEINQKMRVSCRTKDSFSVRVLLCSSSRQDFVCVPARVVSVSTVITRDCANNWHQSASRSVTAESSRPRRGRSPQRRALGGGQLIVERVVEKVASVGLANYPLLTKTNYNQWALLMRIKLEACGLCARLIRAAPSSKWVGWP
jgi:hypothetical protein